MTRPFVERTNYNLMKPLIFGVLFEMNSQTESVYLDNEDTIKTNEFTPCPDWDSDDVIVNEDDGEY